MAVAVMVVIILLNICLLLAVMRIGTMEDFHGEIAAEDSGAVLAWRARLAAGGNDADGQSADAERSLA